MSDPLIIALDVETAEEARLLVSRLAPEVRFFKIGMELFATAGMDFVRELTGEGHDVFLDMKYYDIGETVRRAVAQVAKVGVKFLTVHGSPQIMRAAVEGRGSASLKILAITVLTSIQEQDVSEMGYALPLKDLVLLGVRNAKATGVDGVVASPLEAHAIRAVAGPEMLIVTPGVRSIGAAVGDQKRVATPAEAVRNGADYVVIGRQVTRAPDPLEAIRAIRAELDTSA